METFIKEIVIKPDNYPGKFNFISFPFEKAPTVDWISSHITSKGLFFVLCRTFDVAVNSVNLFKSNFYKLTEYYIRGYRGLPDSSTAFKSNTVILQIWGTKKKVEPLIKLDKSSWSNDENIQYLCKYIFFISYILVNNFINASKPISKECYKASRSIAPALPSELWMDFISLFTKGLDYVAVLELYPCIYNMFLFNISSSSYFIACQSSSQMHI